MYIDLTLLYLADIVKNTRFEWWVFSCRYRYQYLHANLTRETFLRGIDNSGILKVFVNININMHVMWLHYMWDADRAWPRGQSVLVTTANNLWSMPPFRWSFSCFFKHQVELPTRGYSSPTLGALVYSAAPQTPERHAFRCSVALLATAPRY